MKCNYRRCVRIIPSKRLFCVCVCMKSFYYYSDRLRNKHFDLPRCYLFICISLPYLEMFGNLMCRCILFCAKNT